MKRTFPDHAKAAIVVKGSTRGSIKNYWPPKLPLSRTAKENIKEYEQQCLTHGLTPMAFPTKP